MKDDNILLRRIVEYCDAISDDVERFGNDLEYFIEDPSYQRSCCMSLILIGESVNNLSEEFTELHNDTPWRSIVGFRNLVAHRYETVNNTRIWEIITKDVPELRSVCYHILLNLDNNK